MGRSFTEDERKIIRNKLRAACRNSWTKSGYKKTGVDELCREAGISKGAFYLFYDTKEELFGEVLCKVQREIYNGAAVIMKENGGRKGIFSALRYVYCEYAENNFLYGSDSADFALLTQRLSTAQLAEAMELSRMNYRLFLDIPHMKLKVSEEMAVSVIYSLIMGVKNKDVLPEEHDLVFDFMAEKIIDDLYYEV